MRRVLAVLACSVLGASCGGSNPSDRTAPSSVTPAQVSSATTQPPPPSPKPTSSPTTLQLPANAPRTFANPLDPEAVPTGELVPPGAQVTSTWTMSPPDDPIALVGLAWARGNDPFGQEHGFVLWERFDQDPPWRAIYAFTDPPSREVFGIRFQIGDLTDDGIDDVLTFEDMGGSGGCGVWRVISPMGGVASQILREHTCDAQIRNGGGALRIRQAVFQPGDAHCCPSSFETTVLRWDGTTWQQLERTTTSASP